MPKVYALCITMTRDRYMVDARQRNGERFKAVIEP